MVSALGQFALVGNDFSALLDQAVLMATQTLEVEDPAACWSCSRMGGACC